MNRRLYILGNEFFFGGCAESQLPVLIMPPAVDLHHGGRENDMSIACRDIFDQSPFFQPQKFQLSWEPFDYIPSLDLHFVVFQNSHNQFEVLDFGFVFAEEQIPTGKQLFCVAEKEAESVTHNDLFDLINYDSFQCILLAFT